MAQREVLRKRVKNLISQMPKAEIVKHFVKEGYASSTVYVTINRMQNEGPIKEAKKPGRQTSWVPATKARLKTLTNNRTGVSQRRLANKFDVDQSLISRQLSKMSISYRKREKTPKYTAEQQQRAKLLS